MFDCVVQHISTANTKAPRGSLGALSVNKLSHIQNYMEYLLFVKTNDVAFGSVCISNYLPLKYLPTF